MGRLNFASVRLPEGRVHLYGFRHGNTGDRLPPVVVNSLGREIRKFGKRDYIMVEGTAFVPYPVKPPYKTKSLVYALSQVPEVSRIKKLDMRDELCEWYLFPIFFSATDQRILQASRGECRLDVSPEDFERFDEKLGRFRSLLLARTAGYRADALNGDVRVFLGSSHVDEAKGFLGHPESIDAYLSCHGYLRDIYMANESLQAAITKRFKEKRSQCRPKERPLVLRSTVIDETELFHNSMNINLVRI